MIVRLHSHELDFLKLSVYVLATSRYSSTREKTRHTRYEIDYMLVGMFNHLSIQS